MFRYQIVKDCYFGCRIYISSYISYLYIFYSSVCATCAPSASANIMIAGFCSRFWCGSSAFSALIRKCSRAVLAPFLTLFLLKPLDTIVP